VIAEDGLLTYGTTETRANQLAHHLRSLGVDGTQPSASAWKPGAHVLVALLGILKAGAAYLPLDLAVRRTLRHIVAAADAAPCWSPPAPDCDGPARAPAVCR